MHVSKTIGKHKKDQIFAREALYTHGQFYFGTYIVSAKIG